MANPSWTDIAEKLSQGLQAAGFARVYSPYPENVIDPLELPAVVINEPKTIASSGFSLGGVVGLELKGQIDLIVKELPDNQLRLYAPDIDQIMRLTVKLHTTVYANRNLGKLINNISLGEGHPSKISPNTEGDSGMATAVFGGYSVPYTITVQYGS